MKDTCRRLREVYPDQQGLLYDTLGLPDMTVSTGEECKSNDNCETCVFRSPLGGLAIAALRNNDDAEAVLVEADALKDIGLDAISLASRIGLPWAQIVALFENSRAANDLAELVGRYAAHNFENNRSTHHLPAQVALLEHTLRVNVSRHVYGGLMKRRRFSSSSFVDITPELWYWSHFLDQKYIDQVLGDASPVWVGITPEEKSAFLDYHFDQEIGCAVQRKVDIADARLQARYGLPQQKLKPIREKVHYRLIREVFGDEDTAADNSLVSSESARAIASLPIGQVCRLVRASHRDLRIDAHIYGNIFKKHKITTFEDLVKNWRFVKEHVERTYPNSTDGIGALLEGYAKCVQPLLNVD